MHNNSFLWKLKSFYAKSWNDRSRVTVNNEQIEFCRKRHYQYGIFTLKRTKITDLICEWTIELYFRKRSHFNDREARKDVYPTIRMGEFRNFLTVRRLKMERLHDERPNTTCLCLWLFYGVKVHSGTWSGFMVTLNVHQYYGG